MSAPTETPQERATRLLRPITKDVSGHASNVVKTPKLSVASQLVNLLFISVLAPLLLAAILGLFAFVLALVGVVLYLAYMRPSILLEVLAFYLVIDYVRRHKAAVKALLKK